MRSLHNKTERYLAHQFQVMLYRTHSKPFMEHARALIAANNIQGLMDLPTPYIEGFGNALSNAYLAVAKDEKLLWDKRLKNHKHRVVKATADIGLGFDPTHPDIVEGMRRNKLDWVTEFTRKQREATRAALTEGISQGLPADELADLFRDSIGLTDSQMQSIYSYQQALEDGSADALDRALRDRRFDSTIEGIIEDEGVLSADQIERMVGAYTDNWIDYRAETIARTETLGVVEEARDDAFNQALDDAGIESGLAAKEWSTTLDGRERDSHAEMNGQGQALEDPFLTPDGEELDYAGDPDGSPEEIINCRCTVLHQIFDTPEEAAAYFDDHRD